MEKISTTIEKTKSFESLSLANRKLLRLEGIVEILTSSDTQINIKLKDTGLLINGQNMNITKLDVSTGALEVEGIIDCIKYGKSGNIFKRLFK